MALIKTGFADKLRKLRLLLGHISQKRLSTIINIPQSTIATWEAGITNAREENILKLEKLCEKKNINIKWR